MTPPGRQITSRYATGILKFSLEGGQKPIYAAGQFREDQVSTSSTFISPKYRVSDWTRLTFINKSDWKKAILILHDRIEGRFLRMVENIEDKEFSGFAVLALDCLLIETLQQFKEGVEETPRRKVGKYFEDFLTQTSFGQYFDNATAEMFYTHFRCGILHQAEIKGSSKVWKVGELIQKTTDRKGLIVNHREFHAELRRVFASYLRELRNGVDQRLRENFRKKMAFICS